MEANKAGEAPVIDQSRVPDGYIAVPGKTCCGCVIGYSSDNCFFRFPACAGSQRADGIDVVFVKSTSAKSTLLHPMGSMGEEVAL